MQFSVWYDRPPMKIPIPIPYFLKAETENVFHQFIRYLVVGGLAFLVDFSIYFILIQMPFFRHYYLLAGSLSFLGGLVTNYYLSIHWVFGRRKVPGAYKEFILFSVIGVLGLLFNLFFLWLFTDYVFSMITDWEKENILVASKIMTTGLVLIWNFVARKIILF